MSKIKKLIALTLALAMVLSVSAFAGYTADTYADADKINEDCESAVELMYALDIMTGNEKGEFMPEKAVTRAEMAKIIYVILNYGEDDGATNYLGSKFFTDVQPGNWAEGYINYCAATKLIAGRGDGKFDPTAPVTTAEAAKMMLTAIGYNAEARGYVGDKWSDNTLADAATIGLLAGYKANVLEAAPRQWIAVMLENLLVDAYTYINMAPAFSGLLTSGYDMGITTMGAKYYDLATFSSVAVATAKGYIDVVADYVLVCEDETKDHEHDEDCYEDSKTAGKDKVLFANGLQLKNTGLKTPDLGQKYKVIYDAENMKAYSVRTLGATGESRIYEAEYDIKYATDTNKPSNKYVFTFGDVTGTLVLDDNDEINVLTCANAAFETISLDELVDLIDEAYKSANVVKAIDSEDDGDIDYFYVTEYAYGVVTEVDSSDKYGEYINVESSDKTPLELNGENLYLKDCITTDDEIEEDNIVKITKDIDTGKFVIEVLPQVTDAEYEEYDEEDLIFVLDGKEYFIATTEFSQDWEEDVTAYLLDEEETYLGEKLNVIYDGDLIVYIWETDSNYDNMAAVNEQLVLVIDAEDEYSNNTIREQDAIEYMTIDGKTHVAVYDEDYSDDAVAFDEILALATEDEDNDNFEYTVEGRLFILRKAGDKAVYLEALSEEYDEENEIAVVNQQLKVKTSVLDAYAEKDAELDASGSTVKFDGDKVAAGNKFFFGTKNSKGKVVYSVISLDELGKGKTSAEVPAYGQVLTLDNAKGTRTTVVGGYIYAELDSSENAGYLYITDILKKNSDGQKVKAVFADGKDATIVVDNDRDELFENVLYSYTYYVIDDIYELTLVDNFNEDVEIYDLDGAQVILSDETEIKLDDEVIAIVNIEIDRDQTQTNKDDAPEFKVVNKGIKFVEKADLKLEDIENDIYVGKKTYTQYTDFVHVDDDDNEDYLFYVANFTIMETAQEIEEDALYELLQDFFAQLTGGENAEVK